MQQIQRPTYNRSDPIPQAVNPDYVLHPHNPANDTNEQPTLPHTPFKMMSKAKSLGIVCAFAPLVTPDNDPHMEIDFPTTNLSSQDVRSSRPQTQNNNTVQATHHPYIKHSSQLLLSKKSTPVESRFKEEKFSCAPSQKIDLTLVKATYVRIATVSVTMNDLS